MSQRENNLYAMRHSFAHVMAGAVQHIWPHAKFGVGPVIENGFYYDIDLGDESVSDEDFSRIEKEMRRLISQKQKFQKSTRAIDEAIKWAKETEQPYKLELLNDLKRSGTTIAKDLDAKELGFEASSAANVKEVSFYKNGDFTDLCRGPHVNNTSQLGAFKLMRVAGAYWRGKEINPQMQRLYGIAFATQSELDDYLRKLEEAKRRDHRKLGHELDLFTISELVGPGLPLFTPRGAVLRDALASYSLELQYKAGFELVWTPHMARTELYKFSGHYEKYPERFEVTSAESDDVFMMKPMNCPHHVQLFARKAWSYRELPVRYMENTTNYRDEKSGELHGLSRVRSLSQDDGHIFCKETDIGQELSSVVRIIQEMYKTLGMEFYARLSFRDDSDKYLGDRAFWKKAEAVITKIAKQEELVTLDGPGEAAFYGPKIDFMIKDSLDREWQCATVQLDFVQPERFGLKYTDADGQEKPPVMIHKALLGSIERFMSVYIEHTAGRFPVWLSPEQIRLVTVNQEEEIVNFAKTVVEKSRELGLRIRIDSTNGSVSKKIRQAELLKVPYVVVIGEKEASSEQLSPRIRRDIEVNSGHEALGVDNFLHSVYNEARARASKSSL